MNCLEKYRSKLIYTINRNLKIIIEQPEAKAVHDFRVGIKRLTAFYNFLHGIDSNLNVKDILRPYRSLFKSIGLIRDGHIALLLIDELDVLQPAQSKGLIRALKAGIDKDYRQFQKIAAALPPVRMPGVRSTGITEASILRHKPVAQTSLLDRILTTDERMNARLWHKKRILLKRYQHNLDSFHYCPGHLSDENELKQIKVLTQLLGDWHDRVTSTELLTSLPGMDTAVKPLVEIMKKQDSQLLGSAKIYLNQFRIWHRA